jgi:hypothetical protein
MYACEKCEAFISKIASTTERKAILRLKYAPLIREIRVDHKVFVVLSYFWFNDLYVMTPEIPLYFDFYGYFPRSAYHLLYFFWCYAYNSLLWSFGCLCNQCIGLFHWKIYTENIYTVWTNSQLLVRFLTHI